MKGDSIKGTSSRRINNDFHKNLSCVPETRIMQGFVRKNKSCALILEHFGILWRFYDARRASWYSHAGLFYRNETKLLHNVDSFSLPPPSLSRIVFCETLSEHRSFFSSKLLRERASP